MVVKEHVYASFQLAGQIIDQQIGNCYYQQEAYANLASFEGFGIMEVTHPAQN
jgi:hypothetical protein